MSRTDILMDRLSRLNAESRGNAFTTTTLSEFSQYVRADRQSFQDSRTMRRTVPQLALALPIPEPDAHVLYWERREIDEELQAIANRAPNPWFSSGRMYSVNGEQRSLDQV